MAKKKISGTAALVEHNEDHSERLSLEETWPTESAEIDNSSDGCAYTPDEDGTEIFANESSTPEAQNLEFGVSESGPFIAPAPVTPPAAPKPTKTKVTVASMTREQAFGLFRDKLFELCFKYGFTLTTDAQGHTHAIQATDIGDAKGTAKRALAVGNHISGLELRK